MKDDRPKIITLDQIKEVVPKIDAVEAIKEGFIQYSNGRVVVPPVGELLFETPPGDVHIKYGYIARDNYYVVKIASGFSENPKVGLPSGDGVMLLFSQKTGELISILLDGGYLTNLRTAAAGAVVAKVFAPRNVRTIGVVGAGLQGRMQLRMLRGVVECRNVMVWGRNHEEAEQFRNDMEPLGFRIRTTIDTSELAAECNLIITATPSKVPLLSANAIRQGTHITAMGSDTPEKQELDPAILAKADVVVADSLSQCLERGEIFKAMQAGVIEHRKVVELGTVLQDTTLQRTSDTQITVADLTGVAVQDIQIAKAVYESLQ